MIEADIEQGVIDALKGSSNSLFQVGRYYDTSSADGLVTFIQNKLNGCKATAFVRVTNDSVQDQLDTLGEVVVLTFSLDIIIGYNDHGKSKQIPNEPRKVNALKSAILQRLSGQRFSIVDQPEANLVYNGSSDLFTFENIDARQMSFEVQGIVQDLSETGLNNTLEELLNG